MRSSNKNPTLCLLTVAAWAVMGVVWEVCLSSTEGLGEAASVRVSLYLADGFPAEAKLLASKVAFLACVGRFDCDGHSAPSRTQHCGSPVDGCDTGNAH